MSRLLSTGPAPLSTGPALLPSPTPSWAVYSGPSCQNPVALSVRRCDSERFERHQLRHRDLSCNIRAPVIAKNNSSRLRAPSKGANIASSAFLWALQEIRRQNKDCPQAARG